MRIISGKSGGMTIDTLDSRDTRPTTDRVKEAIFNIIQFEINNRTVLDLFAGSGALGLEAASRGAKKVVMVDSNRQLDQIMHQNIEKTGLEDQTEVIIDDSFNFLNKCKEKFDIIFLDPPYNADLETQAIDLIIERELINLNGLIIIERDRRNEIDLAYENFELIKSRNYSDTNISILRRIR
jgi:16S rRNA (guanine966-N2)-methyltransferase